MTKFTLLAIAAFATSIATTATELAGQVNPQGDTETPAAEPTPTKRRGRPANTGLSTEGGTAAPEPEKEKPAVAGGKAEDAYSDEKLKEHIATLVQEEGRGAEVKALIAKHGGNKISDLPAASRPAFYRDIEALKM